MRRFFHIVLLLVFGQIAFAQELELVLPVGHQGEIHCMQLSPDEKYLATGSEDKTVKLWDVRSGLLIQTYVGHKTAVKQVAFNAESSQLISGATDGEVIVWDLETAKIKQLYPGASEEVDALQLSEDGTMLTIIYSGGRMKVRGTADWKLLMEREDKFLGDDAILLKNNTHMIYGAYSSIKKWDVRTTEEWDVNDRGNIYYVSKEASIVESELENDFRLKSLKLCGDKLIAQSSKGSQYRIEVRDTSSLEVVGSEEFSDKAELHWILSAKRRTVGYLRKSKKQYIVVLHPIYNLKRSTSYVLDTKNIDAEIKDAILSPSGRDLFIQFEDKVLRIDLKVQANQTVYQGHTQNPGWLSYNEQSQKIEGQGFSWDLNSFIQPIASESVGVDSQRLTPPENLDLKNFVYGHWSEDKSLYVASYRNKSIKLFDVRTGEMIKRLWGHTDIPYSFAFSADNKTLYSAAMGLDHRVLAWDLESFKYTAYSGHTSTVQSICPVPDSHVVVSSSEDHSIQFWDAESKEKLLTLIKLEGKEWVMVRPDNYYACSPNAALLMSFKQGKQVYPFDQFDMVYNRPDKILESLEEMLQIGSTEKLELYHTAYKKRLKKLGLEEADLSNTQIPVCRLKEEPPYAYMNRQLPLDIIAEDETGQIEYLNVWVNSVPVYGSGNLKLSPRASLDTTLHITLSSGNNKIEVAVINSAGISSLRTASYVFLPGQPKTTTTYIVGFGIDQFADAEYNLNYSVKDVKDIVQAIASGAEGKVEVDTFFNRSVTAENIAAVKQKLMQSQVYDKVIVCYSGHGLLNKELDYFLSTFDVDFEDPQNGGIPYEKMEDLLDGIPARQKLMMIDACHSGEVDKEEQLRIQKISADHGIVGNLSSKGVFVEAEEADRSYVSAFQLMQEVFADVQKGNGATIISAAGGDQYALEGGQLDNGFFTHAFLQYIKNEKEVTISGLKEYVNREVPRLSHGLQQPTSRGSNYSLDWLLF